MVYEVTIYNCSLASKYNWYLSSKMNVKSLRYDYNKRLFVEHVVFWVSVGFH